MLQITDMARDRIKDIMKEHTGKCLSIIVDGYGWGGPQLRMALDEPNDQVKTYTLNEIEVMISDEVLPFTENNVLDFRKDEYGEGFMLGPADGVDCGC